MSKADEISRLIVGLAGAILLAFFGAAAGVYIKSVSDIPCSVTKDCPQILWYMKVPLIATHLLTYALFPFAMLVFWVRAPELKLKGANPLSSILGFGFFMVSMTGEIGWHVGQEWFYKDEYNIMNCVFYIFFMLGIGNWASGLQLRQSPPNKDILSELENKLLLISPLVVTLVYGSAATLSNDPSKCPASAFGHVRPVFNLCSWLPSSKTPIFILMTLEFAVLTRRLYKVLDSDKLVFWVPFFSVGVNVFFLILLSFNVKSTDIYTNPLFHMLHDLAGTELGVFIATLLVWCKTTEPHHQENFSSKKSE